MPGGSRGRREWAHLGSNQGPLACEASALPLSYAPGRGVNPSTRATAILRADAGSFDGGGRCGGAARARRAREPRARARGFGSRLRAAAGDRGVHLVRATGGLVAHRPLGQRAAAQAGRPDLRGRAQVPDAAHAGDPVGGSSADDERLLLPCALVPLHAVRVDGVRAARRRRERDRDAPRRRAVALGLRRLGQASSTARAPRACSTPRLANAYLPVLQTAYEDAAGAKYRQESFVGRVLRRVRRALGDQLREADRRRDEGAPHRHGSPRPVEAALAYRARPVRSRRSDTADRRATARSSSTASCATASPRREADDLRPSG